MKLDNTPSQITPEDVQRALAPVYNGPVAKQGASYYNLKHGHAAVRLLRRLLTYESKSSTVNCRNLIDKAPTLQQKFKQALNWLTDGGFDVAAVRPDDVSDDEWAAIKALAPNINIDRKGNTLYIVSSSQQLEDPLDAMEEFKPSDAMGEITLPDLAKLVDEFIATAEDDAETSINGVEEDMLPLVRKLLSAAGPKFDCDYNEKYKQLKLCKMSEEVLAALGRVQ